jgi:signal transduction histidine kinase
MAELEERQQKVAEPPKGESLPLQGNSRYRWLLRYGVAILAVVAATLLRLSLGSLLQNRLCYSSYYLAIVGIAWYARLGPSLVAIVLSMFAANHFFFHPIDPFLFSDFRHQSTNGAFLAVSITIVLATEFYHRAREALNRANEQLQRDKRHLEQLTMLQDRERQLIGFEIHDGLVQLLAGAKMRLEGLADLGSQDPKTAKESLDWGIKALDSSIKEARGLINDLRPPCLEGVGVVGAVGGLVQEIRDKGHCKVEFICTVLFNRLPWPLENTIFRVVQEGLANACRHSKSERVRLELGEREGQLRIEVQDWGIGFNPQAVGHDHFGLESIRQRARVFGGQATIESRPGEGTRVVVDLPLPSGEKA